MKRGQKARRLVRLSSAPNKLRTLEAKAKARAEALARHESLSDEEKSARGVLMHRSALESMMLICDALSLDNGAKEWSPDTIEEVARIAGLWLQKCKILVTV